MAEPSTIRHLRDLTPDAHNRRRHNPRNIGMLVDALHKVGAARSIVIDEAGEVLAGNGVVEAAAEAGLTKVQVVDADGETIVAVRRTGLTGEQKRALAIYDNRTAELAEWNPEQLRADQADGLDLKPYFSEDELAEIVGAEAKAGLTDPDAVPELRKTDIVRGDLFQLGQHRLLCGDSTNAEDVARVMGGEKADCVFTSPPYGVGVDYASYEDTMANLRAMLPLLSATWANVVRVGGFAVVNFGDIVSGRAHAGSDEPCEYPMALEYWPVFRSDGWLLWSRRVWCKPAAGTGSMQCIGSNRASTNWEHLWTWKRPGHAVVDAQTSGNYPSQNGWIDSTHAHKLDVGLRTHGAGMPTSPALYSVSNHSLSGGVVHEPFCGTGTTLIACEQLNRRCYAIEIEPAYVQVAIDRWEAFTGQKAVKL